MSTNELLLVVIGQIGSGKSEVSRAFAATAGARHVAIEELRRKSGAASCPSVIADQLSAIARSAPVAFECSGASRDFEEIIEELRARGLHSFVVLLQCSIETARRRVHERGWAPPQSGGTWDRQLRWTESRLRLVPADVTFSSEDSPPSALASAIYALWREARVQPPRAVEASLPFAFSYSELSTFEVCPLAYRYKYVDGIPEAVESENMFLGNRLHETLAWMYGKTEASPSREEVFEWFDRRLANALPPNIQHTTVRRLRTAGRKALAFHYTTVYVAERQTTVAVEQPLRMTLGGGLSFVGRADRISLDASGTVEVVDYKLTDGNSTSRPRLPDWLQSAGYAAAVLKDLQLSSVIARRTLLLTGTEQRFALSEGDIRSVSFALRRWVLRTRTPDQYQPNPGPHCASCQFNPTCPEATAVPVSPRAIRRSTP